MFNLAGENMDAGSNCERANQGVRQQHRQKPHPTKSSRNLDYSCTKKIINIKDLKDKTMNDNRQMQYKSIPSLD